MSECRIFRLKPAPRLEWRGQDSQDEAEQCKHCALTLGDSFSRSNVDEVFGTHSRNKTLPQIVRKRFRHSGWPPSPARILNQICRFGGIPIDSIRAKNALAGERLHGLHSEERLARQEDGSGERIALRLADIAMHTLRKPWSKRLGKATDQSDRWCAQIH